MVAKNKDKKDVKVESREEFLRRIETMHLPRYRDIPSIDLYMDQLLTYITDQVGWLDAAACKPLTSSMVNNYVKQRIVPQPESKRYTQLHVAYLLAVCILKRTFSIADIDRLIALEVQHRYQIPATYDFFCDTFEEILRMLLCDDGRNAQVSRIADIAEMDADHRAAVAAATSAACKVYVDKQLDWLEAAEKPAAENKKVTSARKKK